MRVNWQYNPRLSLSLLRRSGRVVVVEESEFSTPRSRPINIRTL